MGPRIQYIVKNYPQLSQTYIKNEIKALRNDYEIDIIALSSPNYADPDHYPYQVISDRDQIVAAVRAFKPAVIHAHYLVFSDLLLAVAQETGIPFTIRAHSFDTIIADGGRIPEHLRSIAPSLNHELCLAVLVYPFTRPYLESVGVRSEKLVDSPPVVDVQSFLNRSPNSGGVMNVGAAIPKKKMEDFIELALRVRQFSFDLFAIGHESPVLVELNCQKGNPITIRQPRCFSEMPAEYKRRLWLVYTACFQMKTVGWPMAIAEAQASGTMVCMANIRPDLKTYVGDAGYLYDSLDEAQDILRSPIPAWKRELGFEQASYSDIGRHKHLLTDRWGLRI